MPPVKSPLRNDVIEVGQQFYISASSSLADDRTRVLLHGDTFAVFDRSGDVQPIGAGQQGIFYKEARHLSRLELKLCGVRPLLLSSNIREDNIVFGIDLTNPDLKLAGSKDLLRGTVHIYRSKFLTDGVCHDQITVHNYGDAAVDVDLSLEFDADYADIFEVRGEKRAHHGEMLPEEVDRGGVTLGYMGLDNIRRNTRIACSVAACSAHEGGIEIPLHIEARQEIEFTVTIECTRQ